MPLSRDERKRRRQLANLRPAPPAPPGNDRAATHRGYAAVAAERLQDRERQVYAALAGDAPLRAPDGGLPASDAVVVRLLAEALCRLEDVAGDIRDHGWRERRSGKPRPAVELERRLRQEALDYAEALGMTPRSRARLGLDLARTVDLATALSDPDPQRREELLREAGLGEEDGK